LFFLIDPEGFPSLNELLFAPEPKACTIDVMPSAHTSVAAIGWAKKPVLECPIP
jgi:hypothetical protein